MKVTRRIELDYGHCLANHYSFCNQIHGHRAIVLATFEGKVNNEKNNSSEGMVLDFSICKKIMMETIHSTLDHAFAIHKDDPTIVEVGNLSISMVDFIKSRNKRFLLTDEPPTAEYLAKWSYNVVSKKLKEYNSDISLIKIRWYETPNNYAEFSYTDSE
jgi:6-pyruvoyltetrahydropterin/6-carboxytetrahydropterin synthase